jgi:response regulator RpfG family c-di-GMP phosphodiesterase
MNPRALFVDDEEYVLRALRRIFIDDNLEIEFAQSAEEAMTYLQTNNVDLILSDHNMPGLSGAEFLRQSRDIQPDCIRMLITGRGDMEVVLQAINLGHIYKFFHKPWDDEDLHISVLRALEFKQTRELIRQQEEKLAVFEAYRKMMVTVSHYINNFNCGLIMSLDSLMNMPGLPRGGKQLVKESMKSAKKIEEVLRILNQLQELKVTDYPLTDGMFDIEEEVKKAVKKIEKGK